MPKTLPSAIGIDIGQHSVKAAVVHRKGARRYSLNGYAIVEVGDQADTVEGLTTAVKAALKAAGSSSKFFAVAATSRDSILRIISQPSTPPELLRSAIALNAMRLLNQECKTFVIDCADLDFPTQSDTPEDSAQKSPKAKTARYLVGGIPRTRIQVVTETFQKSRLNLVNLQLAPIANLNAFAFSNPEAFQADSFMLVDVGHEETTVLMGVNGNLKLVRTIEYGGHAFLDFVTMNGAIEAHAAMTLLQGGDTGMAEASRQTITTLARELASSIAFFEGQHEQAIQSLHISGALCKAELPLQMLSDELELPCQLWDPFRGVDIQLSNKAKSTLASDYVQLGGAYGAALEILDSRK